MRPEDYLRLVPRPRSRATLVVLPVSLVGQWASEVSKHAPALSVLVFHGAKRKSIPTSAFLGADIVLTTYTLLGS